MRALIPFSLPLLRLLFAGILLAGCDPDKAGADGDPTDTAGGEDTAAADADADGDGFDEPEDCDDADAGVYPGAAETPYDGVDNDCDPSTPDDDLDGDGLALADDCDDGDAALWDQAGTYEGNLTAGFASFCDGWCERSVSGHVNLSAASQAGVDALGCLTGVGGNLILADNDALTDLDGFSGLTTIGDLSLYNNNALADVSGLHGLNAVEVLTVKEHPCLSQADAEALVDAIGLENIGTVSLLNNDGPC